MAFRFTIGRKIGTGFGVIILFIIIVFLATVNSVNRGIKLFEESQQILHVQNNVEKPSLASLNQLRTQVNETKRLIAKWALIQSIESDPDKLLLKAIVSDSIPRLLKKLDKLSVNWIDKERKILKEMEAELLKLYALFDEVKANTQTFQDYEDPSKSFYVRTLVESEGDIDIQKKKIDFFIKDLLDRLKRRSDNTAAKMDKSYEENANAYTFLLYFVIFAGIALVVGSVLIASFTTRSIVRPVQELKGMLLSLGRGVFPSKKMKVSNDEIGEMSSALNTLVDGLKRTTDFSNQVGSGNFDYKYQPLSDEDVLGHALLKMRDDLAENERILEQKVIERTEEVVRQKEEIEKQRQKLEELYKDVTDSIRYAKRLQESILPPDNYVKNLLPDSFILFKPKDIVSGDFYWVHERKNKVLFAAVDCTGHGVPGAFMSLVGANAINQAVKEHELLEPSKILDDINKLSSEALNKNTENSSVRDGMDISFCTLDKNSLELQYSAANNPMYLIRNNQLTQISADSFAIGGFEPGTKHYTNHKIQLEKGDCVYVFSDGYADQFGGLKGKKFMYKQFRDTLMEICHLPMAEQGKRLDDSIEKWRGSYEQVDDILVIGVRV